MSTASMPRLDGKLIEKGSLADFIWFRTGGPADWLARPESVEALSRFLAALDPDVPVMPVGVGSNLIVRDGGVPGVVVRLPKAMGKVTIEAETRVRAGAAAMGITVASAARDAGIAGLEFLRGIPGTAGGVVRMNAGAYGRECADVLIEATVVRYGGRPGTVGAALLLDGQRVATVRHGPVLAGQHAVTWDGSGLASGVYLCRLTGQGDLAQTRKMLLVK